MAQRSPRRMRRILIVSVIAVLVLLALWPGAQRVDAVQAGQGFVRSTVEAEGRTRLRDRYVMTAPVAGNVRRIEFEPGDVVSGGAVVATIDPLLSAALDARSLGQAQAAVDAARAREQAAQARAQAAQARARQAAHDARRLTTLAERGLVAAEQAERARMMEDTGNREAASARFELATARHEVDAARAVLQPRSGDGEQEPVTVHAPVDGVIIHRHVESARPVQVGEPLLEIADPTALEVEVDVLSSDAVRMRPDLPVDLLRWGGGSPLPARVRRVEPAGFTKVSALGVEEQRVWVIVDIVGDAPDHAGLGHAYRVVARFILDQADDVVNVPASAVFRHGSGEAVFVLDGRRARLRPIETGLRGEGQVEVVAGLQANEWVIVHPDRQLADGARVRSN